MSSTVGLKKHPHAPWTPLHTTINTSSNQPLPHTCNSDQRRRGAPALPKAEKLKSTRPRLCYTSLSEILCWPAGPHLQKDLQQITGTVRIPLMHIPLHHYPDLLLALLAHWVPERLDTETVSSLKQSISWTLDNDCGTHTIYTLIRLFI